MFSPERLNELNYSVGVFSEIAWKYFLIAFAGVAIMALFAALLAFVVFLFSDFTKFYEENKSK